MMDKDRAIRAKKLALARRATAVERIKSVYDLGLSGESHPIARQKFLISVNDLTDLWGIFVIENDAVLDASIDLDEEHDFSPAVEVETNEVVVSAKALAIRFSSVLNIPVMTPKNPKVRIESDVGFSSDRLSGSDKVQSEVASTVQSSHSVRLPEVPLPQFSGDLADWSVFRDRFVTLVDSPSNISNIEKFYYLLSCLELEASETLKGITVSNDMYSLA